MERYKKLPSNINLYLNTDIKGNKNISVLSVFKPEVTSNKLKCQSKKKKKKKKPHKYWVRWHSLKKKQQHINQ